MENIFAAAGTYMKLIHTQMRALRQHGRMGFMAHAVIGYPDMDASFALVSNITDMGIDILELQIPFSDPLGDGQVIRNACARALHSGFHVRDVFSFVSRIRESGVQIPIYIMGYYNSICQYGHEAFAKDASSVAVDGFIIPDYAHDSREGFLDICAAYNLDMIPFVAPDSTYAHIVSIKERGAPFVYCFSKRGVTGSPADFSGALNAYLQRVRELIDTPRAVGFGIANAQHVSALKGNAEIIVVGSALIRAYASAGLGGLAHCIEDIASVL